MLFIRFIFSAILVVSAIDSFKTYADQPCQTNAVEVTEVFNAAPKDPNILFVNPKYLMIVADGKDDEENVQEIRPGAIAGFGRSLGRLVYGGTAGADIYRASDIVVNTQKNPRALVLKIKGEEVKRFPDERSMDQLNADALRLLQIISEGQRDATGPIAVQIDLRDLKKIALVKK